MPGKPRQTGRAPKSVRESENANRPVWDDQRWSALPSLNGDMRTGACVVGLGGSGLTAIGELRERGIPVVGIDAADVGAGAAGRNGGFLLAGAYDFYHDAVRLHGRDRARAIYAATTREISRIDRETPGVVRWVGSRRLAADALEIEDCRRQLEAMTADGIACRWYDGPDGIGLTIRGDAACNPLARCRAMALGAQNGGALLFARSPVMDIETGRVHTEKGTVYCDRIFVAVDGRLEIILPELAPRVRTARLQMLATQPTTERIVPCPMYYREGFEYWQQLPDGAIALGGFRDHGGEGEWSGDARPGEPVQSLLEGFLREKLGVFAPITHRWAGCAAYTSNGLPVIEEVRMGIWAIGGYSGTGNVIGALCGRAVVALAVEGDRSKMEELVKERVLSRGPAGTN